jgi:hypothetical protein
MQINKKSMFSDIGEWFSNRADRFMRRTLLMLIIIVSADSWAGFKTANDLLITCSTKEGDAGYLADASHCLGYTLGVFDTLDGLSRELAEMGVTQTGFCMPEGKVSAGQIGRIALKHLEENPEVLHYEASSVLIQGFIQAFPCDKS